MAVCWGAFALTWLAGALYNASRGPAQRDRAPFSSVAVIMTIIVLVTFRAVPLADWHALTVQAVWVRVLGLVILAISTAFTLWARLALGIMWSAAPMVKDGHQLRTGGPYAITRHPIYTGIGGMLLGSCCRPRGCPSCSTAWKRPTWSTERPIRATPAPPSPSSPRTAGRWRRPHGRDTTISSGGHSAKLSMIATSPSP